MTRAQLVRFGVRVWIWTVFRPLEMVGRFGLHIDRCAFLVMRWTAPEGVRDHIEELARMAGAAVDERGERR